VLRFETICHLPGPFSRLFFHKHLKTVCIIDTSEVRNKFPCQNNPSGDKDSQSYLENHKLLSHLQSKVCRQLL
jgi:hypothetical protein